MNQKKLGLKFWGSKEAVEQFKKFIDENFLSVTSPIQPSDQGGYHAIGTLTLGERLLGGEIE